MVLLAKPQLFMGGLGHLIERSGEWAAWLHFAPLAGLETYRLWYHFTRPVRQMARGLRQHE